ncbi:MAG TPA: hypothetical protein VGJ94_00980 [Syntrophorhabdaceae bacterium]|jgi:hypothetical protein
MADEIEEEEKKLRRLRFIVDFALQYIRSQEISHDEAISVVEGVRRHAIKLFPGKEETFDLIYLSRFKRLLNDKFKRA